MRRARLSIEVDVTAEPIEGWLRAEDGIVRPFAGYMELVTVLEAAFSAARSTDLAHKSPLPPVQAQISSPSPA